MTTKCNTVAQQQAAVWVTRLYSGEMTVQEERQLRNWRRQATNEQALQSALEAWELSSRLYLSGATTPTGQITQDMPAAFPSARSRKPWHAFAAASIAMAVLSAALWLLPNDNGLNPRGEHNVVDTSTSSQQSPSNQLTPKSNNDDVFRITERFAELDTEQTRTFTTDIGEVSHIKLDDGSNVSLNTASAVRVTMRANRRHVELLYGEAYFDVAKDPQRPFVVSTDEKEITVLGTEFNVRQRSDEKALQVAVIEGRVAVKRRDDNTSNRSIQVPNTKQKNVGREDLGDYEQLLLAGDIAAFSSDSNVIKKDQHNAVKSNSWRRGVVRFDDESLQKVIHELNRYRKQKIQFADTNLHDLRISGVFHLKNGDAILDALTATLPLTVRRSPSHVILEPRN